MRGKEEKKGRGREEKKRRKGGKIGDQIGIKCPCAAFSSAQSSCFVSEIRYLE